MYRPLENGLAIRSMSDEYRKALPQFYVDVFTDAYGPQDVILGTWTEDLLSPHHPTVTDEDVWMVVDRENKILSALLLIPQVWYYEDVKIPVGRVELVATHKDHRHQSLTRTLMEVAHERSAELGHIVQAITGIPFFYRKFGYTMAVKLGTDALLPFSGIPALKDNELPGYTFRPAATEDIPNLIRWYVYYVNHVLLSVERAEKQWAHEINTRPKGIPPSVNYFIITAQNGLGVGYVGIRDKVFGSDIELLEYVVGQDSSYLDTFDDVMRFIKQYVKEKFTDKEVSEISFDNGIHPTVSTLVKKSSGGSVKRNSYAWYIRAASSARLMQQITPVLERRLQGSGANCYTGELKIGFHDKTGLLMRFERGKLVEVGDITDTKGEQAAFPWYSFLNLVFGYHTLDDLKRVFPDSYARKNAAALLEILFPVRQSWIIGQL